MKLIITAIITFIIWPEITRAENHPWFSERKNAKNKIKQNAIHSAASACKTKNCEACLDMIIFSYGKYIDETSALKKRYGNKIPKKYWKKLRRVYLPIEISQSFYDECMTREPAQKEKSNYKGTQWAE